MKDKTTAIEFLEAARQEVHDSILSNVTDRTHEQFLWRPNPETSNIAYLLWHLVRIEDLTIQTQFRKVPLIYEAEGWVNRLGLDSRRPLGLTPEQLDAVTYHLEDFLPYAHKVWNNTSEVLKGMQDEDLEQPVNIEDLPQVTSVGALFRMVLVSHPWRHLGEILYIKLLQGWRYHLQAKPTVRRWPVQSAKLGATGR
jgi:hypothetical protein